MVDAHSKMCRVTGAMLVALSALGGCMAQDLPRIQRGSYWLPAVREVPFVRAEFPIVLEPDAETRTSCYIAIPVERVQEKGCVARFRLMVEEWDELPDVDESNSYEVNMRKTHASLVMQAIKTGLPSGYCASARKFTVGTPCETTLSYMSKPPDRFYVTMHVPYTVKRVTILDFVVEGHRLIEKTAPATPEQQGTIADWIGQLSAEDYATRQAAHAALVAMGAAAVPVLMDFRNDADPERCWHVLQILGEIDCNEQRRMPPVKMAQ